MAAATHSPSSRSGVPADPFVTLGVEPGFEIDLAALERRHRDLSRALHPDRHQDKSAGARRQALSRAIEVNEAFRNLRDPVLRAEALLRHLGIDAAEGQEPKASPELLMAVMEGRERLAQARAAKDGAALSTLAAEVAGEERKTLAALGEAFADARQHPSEHRDRLLDLLGRLRYQRRFLEEAALIEEELF